MSEQEPNLVDLSIDRIAFEIAWQAAKEGLGHYFLANKLRALVLIAQSEANIRADAERERCARIAETAGDADRHTYALMGAFGIPAVRREIAAAIRAEPKPEAEPAP